MRSVAYESFHAAPTKIIDNSSLAYPTRSAGDACCASVHAVSLVRLSQRDR